MALNYQEKERRIGIFILMALSLFVAFAGINISANLAIAYTIFLVFTFFYWLYDKQHDLPISDPRTSWLSAAFWGGLVYIAFIIVTPFALKFLDPVIDLFFVVNLIGATTPVFATSKIAQIVAYCSIAFIETIAIFVICQEWLLDHFKVRPQGLKTLISFDRDGIITKIIMVVIAIFFWVLHLTAKGVTNNAALFLVFIMALVSLSMILIFKEGKQAIMFHFWANFIAALAMFGFLGAAFMVPSGVAVIMLNKKLNLNKKKK